ncbi:MAG: amino acid adenylation domain-containing protein [Hydrogenophaga sp.]|uniref:non-ribosomal peptide synthetase n=1 Tax=Hydrogenophaga sp. TaxID=1904254 RepID=UPI00169653CB|nr:amino acid adenylation domain-containing protein [Hydrogenophaga sp.]NIM40834.1 amino acid adenylation domain-containing protein [Hydrogenophaga sp.]NIN26309.1 amino acid adenylation domain-containing protein [Hydrogenophaga sp.]NIN31174.1 amino acid adenylation domain-containing protein [Hydrogenophaga sp.]NIN55217.1 amino acid adenylation domain-containing protein [Hydrogenophaga sp.]NIO51260.1 amino acid adenylation domain-containing protein [Hydrogenophaga sp.]
MNARELLHRLEGLGVDLEVAEGRLRVSASRGRLDDELKTAIAGHKTELMALLAERGGVAHAPHASHAPKIDAAPRATVAHDGLLPLSLFQERLWILQQLEPESTTYLLALAWPVSGDVPRDQLLAAVQRVHARHLGLRVHFVQEGDVPGARRVDVPPVAVHDLRHLPANERLGAVQAARDRAVHTPIDLSRQTPLRFELLDFAPEGYALIAAAHHIAVDAWSLQILLRELAQELKAPAPAPEPSAGPARLQYADYAAWQREHQHPEAIRAELDWWDEALKGAPQTSMFPPDLPASDAPARGATVDFEFDAAFSAALKRWVHERHATVYMAFLAASAALLRAHTGQGDVLIGSPMGVRERAEFEDLIGPFVNLLVLRLRMADDPDFTELLARARGALLDAHAHRETPFEAVVERVRPVRSFQHSPLFQLAVVYHQAGGAAGGQGDVAVHSGGSLNEITWFAREHEGRILCSLEYRSDLYSAAHMQRLASQLQTLLRAVVEQGDAPISRLPLLTADERRQILVDFNDTARSLDTAPFVRQFERQVASAPDRVAAGFEGASLSYGELNRRANQWARQLRALGVAPGVRVGVCVERSLDMLVALLAVQKAGGAYVPLDPGFPAERLAYMLEDSGAKVLLTTGEAADAVDAPPGVRVFDPAREAAVRQALDSEDLDGNAAPSDPVYVIYTSGSTGRPKGVVVSHGGLSNFLGSMREAPGLTDGDVVAAVTTISFDIAGLELYLPLLVGARVELLSRETASDGLDLAEALQACGATVLQATPATWRLLIESGWQGAPSLRAFCGGEGLPRELADALLARVGQLWNLYGPTETTIWSTAERVAPSPAPVSIGRPIANTQVYVLDAHQQPLPVGVPGELWIGGAGVALGYHQRPELTAERFVADPFSPQAGARLYRTGDLARWDAEGRLQHLGRLDHQVKIRGFRIELGEIETRLATHEAVQQTVVMGREAAPGDLRLVAYIVFAPGADLTASDVRRHLRRDLPDYMIPSVVAAVDAIPLTPNGKVDRAALPDPFKNAVQAARHYVPPEGGAEQTMAEIWRDILKVERVGAEDNFFELGGHSLLSLRVVLAVEQKLGWRMDARTLFFQNLRQVVASAAAGKGVLKA